MKISKLQINQYRHLENLDFDFTYPADFHIEEKRGKPLDKICIIGQSATGKTNILNLMSQNFSDLLNLYKNGNENKIFDLHNKCFFNNASITINEVSGKKYTFYTDNKYSINIDNEIFTYGEGSVYHKLIPEVQNPNLYYFQTNLISKKNIELFSTNPIEIIENSKLIDFDIISSQIKHFKGIINFDDDIPIGIWLVLLIEILDYRKKFNQKMSELIHKGLLADTNKLSIEFEKWQKENPNFLEMFAKKFNPILEKLNLEIDLINTEYTIPIKNKRTDEIIPIQHASTGTKGLLLSFLPIYSVDTKDAIILLDEPERSLYPDMQMDLMDYYQNLAPDAQFIIATHSPFIAASFEPEERFILYFNEEGKVNVRRGVSPIGDDPNDVLKNDFGLEFLMNKEGLKAFDKFKTLKKEFASEKNEAKKDQLLEEILSLAKAYKF